MKWFYFIYYFLNFLYIIIVINIPSPGRGNQTYPLLKRQGARRQNHPLLKLSSSWLGFRTPAAGTADLRCLSWGSEPRPPQAKLHDAAQHGCTGCYFRWKRCHDVSTNWSLLRESTLTGWPAGSPSQFRRWRRSRLHPWRQHAPTHGIARCTRGSQPLWLALHEIN